MGGESQRSILNRERRLYYYLVFFKHKPIAHRSRPLSCAMLQYIAYRDIATLAFNRVCGACTGIISARHRLASNTETNLKSRGRGA